MCICRILTKLYLLNYLLTLNNEGDLQMIILQGNIGDGSPSPAVVL